MIKADRTRPRGGGEQGGGEEASSNSGTGGRSMAAARLIFALGGRKLDSVSCPWAVGRVGFEVREGPDAATRRGGGVSRGLARVTAQRSG